MPVGLGHMVRSWSRRIPCSSLRRVRPESEVTRSRTGIGCNDGGIVGFGIARLDDTFKKDLSLAAAILIYR
jgi:hypothetical protein